MTIYRIKYRRLGFLFDLLSFFAFIAILGTAALYFFSHQPWLYIAYSVTAFAILKSISKSLLSVKISIDTSNMHDPTTNARPRRTTPAAAARPAPEPVLKIEQQIIQEPGIPVLQDVIAEPEPIESEPRQAITQEQERRILERKRLHDQKRMQELKNAQEKEKIQESKRQKRKELEDQRQRKIQLKKEQKHLKQQQQREEEERFQQQLQEQDRLDNLARAKKAVSIKCDFLGELDLETVHNDFLDICTIDNKNIMLCTADITAELSVLETIKKNQITKITYEELRNSNNKKFRLFPWLTAGVVSGLIICLTLVVLSYNKSGKFPGEAWVITTMLPVMALATFGGLFTGILIPHKKTRIYILYTIYRNSASKIRFITGLKGFKRAKRAFAANGYSPETH